MLDSPDAEIVGGMILSPIGGGLLYIRRKCPCARRVARCKDDPRQQNQYDREELDENAKQQGAPRSSSAILASNGNPHDAFARAAPDCRLQDPVGRQHQPRRDRRDQSEIAQGQVFVRVKVDRRRDMRCNREQ